MDPFAGVIVHTPSSARTTRILPPCGAGCMGPDMKHLLVSHQAPLNHAPFPLPVDTLTVAFNDASSTRCQLSSNRRWVPFNRRRVSLRDRSTPCR